MRKVLIPFFVFFISNFSLGQKIAVSVDRNNLLYIGMENTIKIVVENESCKSLVVTIDNGTISGTEGYYVIKPEKTGKAVITVKIKKYGKFLKKFSVHEFRVSHFFNQDNVVFAIGPCGNFDCKMTKGELLTQQYVRSYAINTDFEARFNIENFSLFIYRKDTAILKQNIGNKISEEILKEFQFLQAGDILVFKDIVANMPENRKLSLHPVMVTIL